MRRLAPIAFIVLAAALVLGLLVPLGVAAVAGAIVSGLPPFAGQPVAVSVQASIGGLAGGHLDIVRVAGRPGPFADIRADSIDLRVDGVGLDRSFTAVSGDAGLVTSDALDGGQLVLRRVTFSGSSADGVELAATVDAATVEARVAARLAELGVPDAMVMLMGDEVAIHVLGQTVRARFEIVDGAIVLDPGGLLPTIAVMDPSGAFPGEAVAVETAATGMTIRWRLTGADLASLLGL